MIGMFISMKMISNNCFLAWFKVSNPFVALLTLCPIPSSISQRTSLFVILSSTTSTLIFLEFSTGISNPLSSTTSVLTTCTSGKLKINVAPSLILLSTIISPPIWRAILREMESPNPSPLVCCLPPEEMTTKSSKIFLWSSGAIPLPVSVILNLSLEVSDP